MTASMTGTLLVGMDARPLSRQPTGVGRYVLNLARALARLNEPIFLRLYVPGPASAAMAPDLPQEALGMPRGALRRLDNAFTWTHARLPLHLARHRVDLLHGTFYTLPLVCPCPAVVTIHDITFDLHPDWFTPRARLAFGGFAAASARKARHVITVSERSRRDICERYGIPPAKVSAIPLAPDPGFVRVEDPASRAAVRARYATGDSFLLHVGAITPRRNIPRLLEAFARVRQDDRGLTLVLAGPVEPPSPPLEPLIDRLGLRGAVRLLGYVATEDLPALYSAAAAVVYPSLYEGFGLPVVEAMACGTPVLASDGSCFPEVAGDAALLVDPTDTEAMTQGLRSIVRDEATRVRLVQAGGLRAAGLRWEETARRTLAVYREAMEGGVSRAWKAAAKPHGADR
ncbi:MAG: glycosyltransferase family 4 protein [Candidatus Polarisedimenticolia bacterium]